MRRPVTLLSPLVAQRIAAGEVIERPHSVVRELMDNAVDADASKVDVYLTDGGISSVRVIDDGHGMTKDDLAVCCSSHATSKITSLKDLDSLNTLGFRGEALSSIAACADLKITTGTEEDVCHTLKAKSGQDAQIQPGGNTRGTAVEVSRLFYNIPGRKKFLKSSRSEGNACRKVFLDKVLPFPDIQFRLFTEGEMKLFLPPASLFDRVLHAYGHVVSRDYMHAFAYQSGPVSLQAVISSPALYRTDRSYIQVFVNRRRIHDYSLIQAVSYGYSSVLPGGAFPYCFLFLDLPSEAVDFNIHPAKKEVRFRAQREIHHLVSSALREWVESGQFPYARPEKRASSRPSDSAGWFRDAPAAPPPQRGRDVPSEWFQTASSKESAPEEKVQESPAYNDFIYLGQIFSLFLLVQKDNALYIIDQHAAHERIIYEQLRSQPGCQPLLIPLSLTVEDEIHQFITNHRELYRKIGITLEHKEHTTWEITSVPSVGQGIEHDIAELIAGSAGDPEEIEKKLYALISCRQAVKDGEVLDPLSAKELAGKALRLTVPRCPHGRPIWREISRDELFQDMGRVLTGRPDQACR